MKKILFTILALIGCVAAISAQEYRILSDETTTVKAKIGDFSAGSRQVRLIVYDYPSVDGEGQPATVSGVILIPSDIADGTVPCDGIIMYNHYTIGKPEDAPSQGGDAMTAINALVANPLKPNYIIVASDYVGYGSSASHNIAYISGDTNGRNSLDGLIAARQLLSDEQIAQGKYLFNIGFSQGGTESMFAAKLTDTEEKYKDIRFDKTCSGGGPLDFENLYSSYVKQDKCEDLADVVMMLISVNENHHLGISYNDLFQEPVASKAIEYFTTKRKSVVSEIGVTSMDHISQVLQPAYMDLKSDAAKSLCEKLREIGLTKDWEPDVTKNYYIEHSRHDNYVPIQCVRGIIPWMTEKGFDPSIVPGKSTLQTCTAVFKLKHQESAIVWAIQTMAAIQFWPVLYYEGEQNRYYHEVMHDMNLMKVIKTLESWGIDLRKLINDGELNLSKEAQAAIEASADSTATGAPLRQPERWTWFDLIPGIDDTLAKVGLTTDDLEEMCDDAGISAVDLLEAYSYIKLGIEIPSASSSAEQRTEAPLFLLRQYEQQLAAWYLFYGFNIGYEAWGM